MTLEDELAAVMHAHDHEAPDGTALRSPAARRTQRWLPLAAALAVALAVVGTILGVRATGHAGADGAGCPGLYRSQDRGNGWVPAPPSKGVADDRLTPGGPPSAVTICAYLGHAIRANLADPVPLTDHRMLAGDLAAVTRTLSLEPGTQRTTAAVCQQYLASTDGDDFLIALHFASGIVWVAAPGDHCAGATNGVFSTSTNLRAVAAASYLARRWVADPQPDQPEPERPVSCPTHYRSGAGASEDGWVPSDPPRSLRANRLTPTMSPGAVTVCSYLHGLQTPAQRRTGLSPLTGHRELGGDLSEVSQTLSREPRRPSQPAGGCPLYAAATDGDNYLLGLAYPTGTVWVAAPGNHCAGATNGVFRTTANLRAIAAASYSARRWVTNPPPTSVGTTAAANGPCERGSAGRLGQDTAMVPSGVTSLDICVGEGNSDGAPLTPHHVSAAAAGPLVHALNALPSRQSTQSCLPDHPSARLTIYRLYFHYDVGPDVDVHVTVGCRPEIDNFTLQAADDGTVTSIVHALVR